jgi:peptide deformylase
MPDAPIVQAGDPVLRTPAAPVPEELFGSAALEAVVARLWAALEVTPGVGLAAPQIGEGLRVAVVHDLARFHESVPPERLAEREREVVEPYVLVNPTLRLRGTARREFFEGCLSVAGYVAAVDRAHALSVTYRDVEGRPHERTVEGWHARILQHEVDHLDGVLYVDRMTPRTLCAEPTFRARYAGLAFSDAVAAVGA